MRKIWILPILIIGACTGKLYLEAGQKQMEYFYEMQSKGKLEKSLEIVGQEGFQDSSREEWLGLLRGNIRKRGQLQSHELLDWEYRDEPVKTLTMTYRVTYENGVFTEKAAFREESEKRYLKLVGYDSGNPARQPQEQEEEQEEEE